MPVALPVVALVSFAIAFITGWLTGKAYFSNVARLAGHRAARQQETLEKHKRQYRHRTGVLREITRRLRRELGDIRQALGQAESGLAAEKEKLHDLRVQLAVSNARLAELEATEVTRSREHAALQESHATISRQLDETRERVSSTEQATGLLRIERDELMARTQRVRIPARLPAEFALQSVPATADVRAETGALRESIAERDGRIHELECKLREADGRATELDTALRNWKHRVAPLVLQLRIQRERNRKLRAMLHGDETPAPSAPSAVPAAPAGTDDLKRIRGIGPSIERKLRAHGIHEYRQIAELGPDDLAGIAARLSLPATRPARDGWIEQARALYAAKKQQPASTFG